MRIRLCHLMVLCGLVSLLVGLTGCGGGGQHAVSGGGPGTVALRIYWPPAAREIPAGTQGIYVQVIPQGGNTPFTSQWTVRPNDNLPTTTVTLYGIPAGVNTLQAFTYSTSDQAAAMASPDTYLTAKGGASVPVTAGGTSYAQIYLLPKYLAQTSLAFSDSVNGVPHIFTMDATGQGKQRVVSPSASGGSCTDPSLSPDGAEVVFICGGHLWTAPSTGAGTATQLTSGTTVEKSPAWSPDGTAIAYLSTSTEGTGVYVATTSPILALGAVTTTQVTGFSGDPVEVAWADTRSLFVVTLSEGLYTLYRMNPALASTPQVITTSECVISSPCLNPSTQEIAYLDGDELVVWDMATMTDNPGYHPGGNVLTHVQSIAWVPDGSRLALCWAPTQTTHGLYLLYPREAPVAIGPPSVDARDVSITPALGAFPAN